MSKIICCPSLVSASEFVLGLVSDARDGTSRNLVLVPDRWSMIAESKLLDFLGVRAVFDCEVLSINRLCSRILDFQETYDMTTGVMLLHRIFIENKSKLNVIGNITDIDFCEELYRTIMQLRSSGIECEDLSAKVNDQFLDSKMADIQLLYREYLKQLENASQMDGLAKIDALIDQIPKLDYFNNCNIYMAFYESWTEQYYKIVQRLVERGNQVVVAVVGNGNGSNEHIFDTKAYDRLTQILSKSSKFEVVDISDTKPKFIEHIRQNLFSYSPKQMELDDSRLQLFECNGETIEIEAIAGNICRAIRGGLRFFDINLGVSNIDKYLPIITKVFDRYDIPFFADAEYNIRESELGKFVIDIFRLGFSACSGLDLQKIVGNYYFGLDRDSIVKWNNFIYENNICDFHELVSEFYIGDEIAKYVHNKIAPIMSKLSNCKLGRDYVELLNYIFQEFQVEQKTSELAQASVSLRDRRINEQIDKKIADFLVKVDLICCDTPLSAYDFFAIIDKGLRATKIHLVPLALDCVMVGDVSISTFEKRKMLILAGCNYGEMPLVQKDCGLISDDDIECLSSRYLIDPSIASVNHKARFRLWDIIGSTTDRFIVSYLSVDNMGNAKSPSSIVESLRKCFVHRLPSGAFVNIAPIRPNEVQVASGNDELVYAQLLSSVANLSVAREYVLRGIDRANEVDVASVFAYLNSVKDPINKLIESSNNHGSKRLGAVKSLGEIALRNRISSSQITNFYTCPYKHFLSYGLRLKKEVKNEITVMNIGNILHKIAEKWTKYIMKNGIPNASDVSSIVNEFCDFIIQSEISRQLIDSNKLLIEELRIESVQLANKLSKIYSDSNLVPTYIEYVFDNILIKRKKFGNTIKIVGKIDRVDTLENKFFVIDYKTGSFDLSLDSIYYGKSLQLLIYVCAMGGSENCVGLGYFPIKSKYEVIGKSEQKIEGMFKADEFSLAMLDKAFDQNAQKYDSKNFNFSTKLNSKGEIKFRNNCYSNEKLQTLCDYAISMAERAVDNIDDGYIEPVPLDAKNDSCKYCEYRNICKRDFVHYRTKSSAGKSLFGAGNEIEEGADD